MVAPPDIVRGNCVIGGTNMSRVIAVMACGFILTGCSSSWMPSIDMPSFGGSSVAQSLAVESDPPGAEARASSGATCRTPCRLDVTATDGLTVNIALNGYVPKSVPIHVLQPDDPRLGSEDSGSGLVRLDPNPVYVELERAPSPAAPVKKKSRHAPTAARQAPANAAVQAPQAPTTAAAPPAAGSGGSSWPMPR